MIIVSGWLRVAAGQRDEALKGMRQAVEMARVAPGCLDFALSSDVVDDARINVYERWDDETSLLAFRGSGPDDEQQAAIVDADVRRYTISAEGPA